MIVNNQIFDYQIRAKRSKVITMATTSTTSFTRVLIATEDSKIVAVIKIVSIILG